MSDHETRDALIRVDIDLPNGKVLSGRPIPFRTGMTIKALLAQYWETASQEDFDRLFAAFSDATGIDEATIVAQQPDLSLLELTDFISRFIYLLRPGRTAAQVSAATPAAPASR